MLKEASDAAAFSATKTTFTCYTVLWTLKNKEVDLVNEKVSNSAQAQGC